MHDTIWSKKFWFSVGAVGALFGYAALAAVHPALIPMYETFAGALVGISGLYLAGNIGNKFVASRAEVSKPGKPDPNAD